MTSGRTPRATPIESSPFGATTTRPSEPSMPAQLVQTAGIAVDEQDHTGIIGEGHGDELASTGYSTCSLRTDQDCLSPGGLDHEAESAAPAPVTAYRDDPDDGW